MLWIGTFALHLTACRSGGGGGGGGGGSGALGGFFCVFSSFGVCVHECVCVHARVCAWFRYLCCGLARLLFPGAARRFGGGGGGSGALGGFFYVFSSSGPPLSQCIHTYYFLLGSGIRETEAVGRELNDVNAVRCFDVPACVFFFICCFLVLPSLNA